MADPAARRRPTSVALVLLGVVALGLIAVVAGLVGGGDDDDDTASAGSETRDVEVRGDALVALEDPADDPAVGQPAPELDGLTFSGEDITVGGAADEPSIVVFLAHWCPHCQREVPVLVDHFEEAGVPEDVDVFAITTSVDPSAPNYPPSAWLEREGWDIPTLYDDEAGSAARAFGLSGFPYFVAIDADGNVVARASGELEPPQFEALLDAARGG